MENKDLEGYRVYGYSNKTLNKPIVETFYTDKTTEEILREFEDCKINFTNSYGIGYTDWRGEHVGRVNYFDIEENELWKDSFKLIIIT